jgi:outer membrane protein OmpA-like peptidoglycan-associated protein
MSDRAAIIPDMPIFGSDGALVGTVHRVSGVRIIVNHVGASETDQHVIPLARVATVTDRVTLDCPAADAGPERMAVTGGRRSFPFAWLGVALVALALVYGGASMILRWSPAPKPPAAPTRVAKPEQATIAAAKTAPAPVAPPRATGLAEANPASLRTYLASDVPASQRFALDAAFAGGSATLSAGGEASVRGIAGVMSEHLNTKIKLAASGGGLALRRAAAVRRALVAYGVADYRIATGAARTLGRSGSGLELIVLAK